MKIFNNFKFQDLNWLAVRNAIVTPKFTIRNVIIATVLGIFLGYISLVGAFGANAANTMLSSLFKADFNNSQGSAYFINKITIIGFSGLAVAVALKAGILNIGVSGQMTFGALIAYLILNKLDANTGTTFVVGLVFCILGSVALSLFMGLLKAFLKVNEVITAIMINWVVVFLAKYFENNAAGQQITLHNALYKFGSSSLINYAVIGLLLFIAIGFVIWYVYTKTSFGYKVVRSGESEHAAEYAGYKAKTNKILIFVFSGALAGLAGFVMYFFGQDNISTILTPNAFGFTGIAVALVGMNNAIGILFSAFLFAIVDGPLAGLSIPGGYENQLLEIFTAVVTYFVAIASLWIYFRPIIISQNIINKIRLRKAVVA